MYTFCMCVFRTVGERKISDSRQSVYMTSYTEKNTGKLIVQLKENQIGLGERVLNSLPLILSNMGGVVSALDILHIIWTPLPFVNVYHH